MAVNKRPNTKTHQWVSAFAAMLAIIVLVILFFPMTDGMSSSDKAKHRADLDNAIKASAFIVHSACLVEQACRNHERSQVVLDGRPILTRYGYPSHIHEYLYFFNQSLSKEFVSIKFDEYSLESQFLISGDLECSLIYRPPNEKGSMPFFGGKKTSCSSLPN